MSKTWQHITLIVSLILSISAYTCWGFMWSGFYYQAMAVSILLWMVIIRDLSTGFLKKIATIGMWLAVSNLLDEVFFDPKAIQVNEYVFALIVIIITLKKKGNARKI